MANLIIENKKLVTEWDYEKNRDFDINKITIGSHKKVWWKCEKGHEWEATIRDRNNGNGCPYCANKKIIKGYNDLETLNPKLSSEWNYERNSFLPSTVSQNSNRKAWWKCEKGHEWEATISSRNLGGNCPYCSNKKILKGYNDLATTNPQIAKEWNYKKNKTKLPTMFSQKSGKKVWWECEKGHEWEATIVDRYAGNKCPICTNRKILKGYNDLATTHPQIVEEWDYEKNINLLPTEVTSSTTKKVWWKCKEGHEWATYIRLRIIGHNCPVCSMKKGLELRKRNILKKRGNFADCYPELAEEWNYEKNINLLPTEVTSSTTKKVWWKCKEGHEWETPIYVRTKNNSGCPYCAGKKAISGVNDIFTTHKYLKKIWNYEKNFNLKPENISFGSDIKVWWKCKEGHEWESSIYNMVNRKSELCPYCSNQRLLKGYNDLETKFSNLIKEWDHEKNINPPSKYLLNSNEKVWWKCEKKHSYRLSISNKIKGTQCPICANREILIGYNDLVTTHPHIAKEWNYEKNGNILPTNFAIGSHAKVWWKCEKGHEWKTTISHRKETNCPECIKSMFTSFPEQSILFYLKKIFKDVKNRYSIKGNEIDIYVPKYNIGIEYDGGRYHNNSKSYEREKKKYEALKKENITLIRIKEIRNDKFIKNAADYYLVYNDNKNNRNLNKIINDCIELISKLTNIIYECDIDYYRDRTEIYNQYYDLEKENSIANLYPNLINEWNYEKNGTLLPTMVTKGSEVEVWWKCEKGHEWISQIKNKIRGNGCPYCNNSKILIGYNDLMTTNPDLVKEWNYEKNKNINPTMVTKNSGKKVWWKCKKGHEWEAIVDSRTRGSGCPYCAGKKIIKGYNDLETFNPNLAKEWNYEKNSFLPSTISQNSNKKVWWKCEKGHEWEAVINSRSRGRGCPYCANQKILKGYNDLATTNPDLIEEWDYIENNRINISPDSIRATSEKVVNWICKKCGHHWKNSIANRKKGKMCPKCADKTAKIRIENKKKK